MIVLPIKGRMKEMAESVESKGTPAELLEKCEEDEVYAQVEKWREHNYIRCGSPLLGL